MCYFHVNAIVSLGMATRMIDRAGKVRAGRRERKKDGNVEVFFNFKCIFLTLPTHKHTLMHKDKNKTIYSNVEPLQNNRRPKT